MEGVTYGGVLSEGVLSGGGFVRAPFYAHVTSLQWISHSSRILHIRLISMSMQLTQIINIFSKCLH